MGNHGGIGKTEVKFSVGLIGGLLAILATLIVHRSGQHSAVDQVPTAASRVVTDREVVPAEFHAKTGTPVVLKPRASLPPPVYAAQGSPAPPPASPGRSVDTLPMASGPPAARDFMPKLPATAPSDTVPSAAEPADDPPPRYAPVVMPQVHGRAELPAQSAQRTIGTPTTAAPTQADAGPTQAAATPLGPPAAEAAAAVRPPPAARATASDNLPPQEKEAGEPLAKVPTRVPPTDPSDRVTDRSATVKPPPPSDPTTDQRLRPSRSGSYIAKPGDSMWSIAKKAFGRGAFFRALVEHNRALIPVPERLAAGDRVLTPPRDLLRQKYPHLCPPPDRPPVVPREIASRTNCDIPDGGRRYLVEEGDTLAVIARYELGDVNRWTEIYQLNRALLGSHPESLSTGTWLILPPPASRSATAHQRTNDLHR